MSVSTVHKDYPISLKKWKRCRDVVEGKDKLESVDIGSSKGVYLQKPEGLELEEFRAYVSRASWFGATSRTIDALAGLIMAKAATVDYPMSLSKQLDDISLSGIKLREFAQHVVVEHLTTSREGIFVDMPKTSTEGMTRSQVSELNIRPWMKLYKAESIINWRTKVIGNQTMLTLVVLKEEVEVANGFETDVEIQFRVLELDEDGYYRMTVYSEEDTIMEETSYPLMNGERMRYIPFFMPSGNELKKPVILDMVDTNIAHYRNSADYEHALRFTVPMPIISGVSASEDDKKITIGSLTALVLSDPAARGSYLEFSGQGLKPLQEAMRDKEFRMAVLGARMLSDEKKASEAVGTVEIRTSAERSVLTDLANDVSDAIQKALKVMAEWSGQSPDDVRYSLNVDYGINRLDYHTMKELVAAWQSDAITFKTLFENLKRGDIVSPDEQFEDYQDEIMNNPFTANGEQMQEYAVGKVAENDKTFIDNVKERLGIS
jgi:hypothetical protein